MNKTAILLTCFNRKQLTKKCLSTLFSFKLNFDVYLVDDGSNDGTSDMISKDYPSVNIINGSGYLFWNRGMELAWKNASKYDYDFYIWLNDDIVLFDNAFDEIFKCSAQKFNKSIVSGIIQNHAKNRVIYGGYNKKRELVIPNGKMNEITRLNGNFVLVPKYVYLKLGRFDTIFHHDLGDVDYGLRARQYGINVYSTRVPVGSGQTNHIVRERLYNSSITGRFKRLYSALGSNPNINFIFRKRHFGFLNAIFYYIYLIFINIIPDKLSDLIFKNKFK